MKTPDSPTRASVLRTVLRLLVLGAFACTVTLVVLLVGTSVLSAIGLLFDPHGYRMYAGILFTPLLASAAFALWLLHRSVRRRGN